MASKINVPDAPQHLSASAAKKWQAAFSKALDQATLDYPESASTQRSVATKAANALLAVTAPTSAAEIDKLDDWQALLRETRNIKGVATRVCVTADGRKYAFPIPAGK